MTYIKRNVIDYYQSFSTESIKADLETKRFNYSILCCNLSNDYNKSVIVRCGNIFLAKEVILYGQKNFDRRGCVGTQNYTNFRHVRVTDDLDAVMSEFDLVVGVDNIEAAVPINDFQWNKNMKTLLCFGEEQLGLAPEIIKRCNHIVYIKQYGSCRSLNVASSAAIVMYDYINKTGE